MEISLKCLTVLLKSSICLWFSVYLFYQSWKRNVGIFKYNYGICLFLHLLQLYFMSCLKLCYLLNTRGSLSPPPTGSTRGFFSDIYCENLAELLEVILTILLSPPIPTHPPKTGCPWSFLSCLHWTSSNSSITVPVFLLKSWFPLWFPLLSLCSGGHFVESKMPDILD